MGSRLDGLMINLFWIVVLRVGYHKSYYIIILFYILICKVKKILKLEIQLYILWKIKNNVESF